MRLLNAVKLLNNGQQKLYRFLERGYPVWVIYLDIVKFHEIEFRHGNKTCKRILDELERKIGAILKKQRSFFRLTWMESRGGDDFVVYFVPNEITPWPVAAALEQWVLPLEDAVNAEVEPWIRERVHFRAGIVLCSNEAGRSSDYLLYAAVKEAFLLNKAEPDPLYFARRQEVARLLQEPANSLRIAFQPILHVESGEIFGFEALARTTGETYFTNIAELFPFAEKIGQLYPVETICRRLAVSTAPTVLRAKEYLFLNINPQVLTDPGFASGQTLRLLQEKGLSPTGVVLEITERSAIDNFGSFRRALAHYRNQGYLIALDDVGAGYSSLQSIAELQPDFLKVDRSLISGVNSDPVKWALLETFVNFSRRIGCRILAEGVETSEEMNTVVQLGVDYVQGFFVGKPSFGRTAPSEDALQMLTSRRRGNNNDQNSVSALLEPLPLFDLDTLAGTVENFFRVQTKQWLVGVLEGERIAGILEREKFFAALGTLYGVSLYSKRTISLLIDRNPLIVEESTPIEVASRLAMERPDAKIYSGIVVVKQHKPVGMVSVASLIKAMAEHQIQIARGANPLTGLPGNMLIDRELRQRLDQLQPFGLVYVDLNRFKHFNDIHGFQRGDQAIKVVADILRTEAAKADEQAFIGHIGGDDFLVVLEAGALEPCCRNVLARFAEERAETDLGSLSVALAAILVPEAAGLTPGTIAEQAALVKQEVKKLPESSYLIAFAK